MISPLAVAVRYAAQFSEFLTLEFIYKHPFHFDIRQAATFNCGKPFLMIHTVRCLTKKQCSVQFIPIYL